MRNKHIFISVGAAVLGLAVFFLAHASTNISSTSTGHWAWNDSIGWIDFYDSNSVTATSTGLVGYATSPAGDVSLDCHTSEAGNICAHSTYQVLNDGLGNLTGWAWNDEYGWISFCGGQETINCPGGVYYQVTIDSSGNFQGYAWNDAVGWIDFNCDNNASCGTSNYEVSTSFIPSAPSETSSTAVIDSDTFDTGVANGVELNSVLWQGTQPAGTEVEFQFAVSNTSNASTTWNFMGPDGTSNTYFVANVGVPVSLVSTNNGYALFNGYRYFRYQATLVTAAGTGVSPTVNKVVVNWSP